jgi:hypothetical protein
LSVEASAYIPRISGEFENDDCYLLVGLRRPVGGSTSSPATKDVNDADRLCGDPAMCSSPSRRQACGVIRNLEISVEQARAKRDQANCGAASKSTY